MNSKTILETIESIQKQLDSLKLLVQTDYIDKSDKSYWNDSIHYVHRKRPVDKCSTLGDIGEWLVEQYHFDNDMTYKKSDNPWDSEKDGINDNGKVEIKTQVPFIFRDSFTIRPNQLEKVTNADTVYFVTAPTDRPYRNECCIYECKNPKDLIWNEYTTKDRRTMLLARRGQECLNIVQRFDNMKDVVDKMKEVSSSKNGW
jgi:hypothetical protein